MRLFLLGLVLLDVSIRFERLRPNEIKLAKTFAAKSDYVVCAELSPDAKFLFTGRRNGTMQIYDLASGEQKVSISAHTSYVCQLIQAPDGSMLISASLDGTVKFWDSKTLKEIKSIQTGSPCYAVFLRGSSLAASCRESVTIYDIQTMKTICTVPQESSNPGFGVAIIGESLWITGTDGHVKIYEIKTAKHKSIKAHDSYVTCLDSYANFTVTCGLDKKIRLWNGETVTKEINSSLDSVHSVRFSKTGRYVVVAGIGGIEIFDRTTGNAVKTFSTNCGIVYISLNSTDGRMLGVGADNIIRIYHKTTSDVSEPKVTRKTGLLGINPEGHTDGVKISGLIEGGQAQKLDIKAGGIITQVDGRKMQLNDLVDYITKSRFEGDEIYIKIKYDNGQTVYRVRLGTGERAEE